MIVIGSYTRLNTTTTIITTRLLRVWCAVENAQEGEGKGSSPSCVNRSRVMATSSQTSKERPNNENQPLKIFFSRYSRFQYRPENPPIIEFERFCKEYRWGQHSAEKKAARYEFNLALIKEFNSLYGSDEKDIDNWYKLCHVLRIEPVPNTLHECRAVSTPLRGPFNFHNLAPGCLNETCQSRRPCPRVQRGHNDLRIGERA